MCIIHDHPHHYRLPLFEALGRSFVLSLIYTSNTGGDRKGLELPPADGYGLFFLTAKSYGDVLGHIVPSVVAFVKCMFRLFAIRPSVLILHGYSNPACWAGWVFANVYGAKAIVWGESNKYDLPRKAPLEFVKRVFLSRCQQAHVYGRSAKSYFVDLGMPEKRVFITQPTIVDSFYAGKPIERVVTPSGCDTKRVLYVGRFAREKNLVPLLDSFSEHLRHFQNSKIDFTLVGFGPLDDELRRRVKMADLRSKCHVRGKVQPRDLPALYAEFDLLILPSTYEPYGLVVLEAMFSGLAVAVSTQSGCVADLVTSENGFTFDPWRKDAMCATWRAIESTTPDLISRMKAASVQRASQFTTNHSADLTIKAVNQLLAREKMVPEGDR